MPRRSKGWLMLRVVFIMLTAIFILVPLGMANDSKKGNAYCLDCHETYEELEAKEPFYTTPSGELINPHRYIEHNTKDVPGCESCHQLHSEEVLDASEVEKPKDVPLCYECHHMQVFITCETCH